MTTKERRILKDKLLDIARWYSMPADHFNTIKKAVEELSHDCPMMCIKHDYNCPYLTTTADFHAFCTDQGRQLTY